MPNDTSTPTPTHHRPATTFGVFGKKVLFFVGGEQGSDQIQIIREDEEEMRGRKGLNRKYEIRKQILKDNNLLEGGWRRRKVFVFRQHCMHFISASTKGEKIEH